MSVTAGACRANLSTTKQPIIFWANEPATNRTCSALRCLGVEKLLSGTRSRPRSAAGSTPPTPPSAVSSPESAASASHLPQPPASGLVGRQARSYRDGAHPRDGSGGRRGEDRRFGGAEGKMMWLVGPMSWEKE
jgi:hypothetical protein